VTNNTAGRKDWRFSFGGDVAGLRAMLFDLWGTLVLPDDAGGIGERRSAVRLRMASEALASMGFDYTPDAIERAFAAANDEHGRIHADGRDLTAEGRTVLYLRHLDPDLGGQLDDDGWRRMHDAVLAPALTARPIVTPGALDVLAEIRSLGLHVGLVSDAGTTPGYVLRTILQDMGLLELLDVAIFSDEVEVAKPSAAIFECALDSLDVRAAEAGFIGDQPVLDVLGAQNAGVVAIQFGDLSEDGITPDARITAFDDLVPALRRLGLLSA
jgi:FMN phosphatase YigB (HAD superfamily)